MPMQSVSAMTIEAVLQHLAMSAAQVNDRVNTAKSIVRDAIGMNNHIGSAAISDLQLMTYLMTNLQEKHLFVLDSRSIA